MAPHMSTNNFLLRNDEIGRRIKLRRLQLGLSEESLGVALGVTFEQVQKYERGSDRIGAGRLQQVAEILKVPILFFFGGNPGEAEGREESDAVLEFLDTAYSLRLVQAFGRIRDRHIRQCIVEIVEQVADKTSARGG
jgi:transcriptional regulator with XRE-family HTH domain